MRFIEQWYGSRSIDYLDAWNLQREIHAQRVQDRIEDTVLLLEHPAVYTAGKRTEPHERPRNDAPVIDVDRGGKITFHGPGQLVGYPIVKLPPHVLVVDYVRRIEEALIRALAEIGIRTGRVPGRSGVWLAAAHQRPERKIAAIGIRVSRSVAMHGFSLNCSVDLDYYNYFVPCGIADAGVTSIAAEAGSPTDVAQMAGIVSGHLTEMLKWEPYTTSPDIERTEYVSVLVNSPVISKQA